MNKKDYDSICNILNEKIESCKKHFSVLNENLDLEELSLKQLKELLNFCKSEYPEQSHILMVDLYHILTMGNLTAIQTTGIIKLIKKYSSYRPLLNKLGKDEINITKLPDLTNYNKTYYNCNRFNLILGDKDSNEIMESLESFKKQDTKVQLIKQGIPYKYFNKTTGEIHFDLDKANAVANFLVNNTALFADFNKSCLAQHLTKDGQYGSYLFKVNNEGEVCGIVSIRDNSTTLASILSKMNLPEVID